MERTRIGRSTTSGWTTIRRWEGLGRSRTRAEEEEEGSSRRSLVEEREREVWGGARASPRRLLSCSASARRAVFAPRRSTPSANSSSSRLACAAIQSPPSLVQVWPRTTVSPTTPTRPSSPPRRPSPPAQEEKCTTTLTSTRRDPLTTDRPTRTTRLVYSTPLRRRRTLPLPPPL